MAIQKNIKHHQKNSQCKHVTTSILGRHELKVAQEFLTNQRSQWKKQWNICFPF